MPQQEHSNASTSGLGEILNISILCLLAGLLLYAGVFVKFLIGVVMLFIAIIVFVFIMIIVAIIFKEITRTSGGMLLGGIFGALLGAGIFKYVFGDIISRCLVDTVRSILSVI